MRFVVINKAKMKGVWWS